MKNKDEKNVPVPKKSNFSAVKSFGGFEVLADRKCTGLGIRFGDAETKDFYGDYFTPLTETGLKNGSDRPFLIEHWENDLFAWKIVGTAVYEKTAEGWAYEATLRDDEVGEMAYDLIKGGDLKSSTGSAWNYTRGIYTKDDAYQLTTWLVIEQSATKKPADYYSPIVQVKSIADFERMSAIIAPLLAEREQDQFKLASMSEEFERLKSEVELVKSKVAEYTEIKGVQLPDEIEQEVQSLLSAFGVQN